jgi:hypothetical protein
MLELFAPRRVAVPDLRVRSTPSPRWPSQREATARPRYQVRARKLTPDQEALIRALAVNKSLRGLAAEFGVSHETIRAVVRQDRSATA